MGAQTWTVIGMGFALFAWLLVQIRTLDQRMRGHRDGGHDRSELAGLEALDEPLGMLLAAS
ncbi:hypothetical protein [Humibacter sp.]|uniref:hypothetical protein n=1 Tax=Humibacter sp. TaxID=1940291 RepID=UPI002BAD3FFE|nr:hypothetical protein [Humibacter sp.]HVX08517.1 hypothetical protein [Humibacter sp.]